MLISSASAPGPTQVLRLGAVMRRCAWLPVFVLLTAVLSAAEKSPWDPIDPADLAATTSQTSPGAEAEYLFIHQRLVEHSLGLESDNYVRAKLYTRGGVDHANLLRVESGEWLHVRKLQARVVKPDGRSLELKKEDFHESTLVKDDSGASQKVISFAFPNLEPGDIVEYRWREQASTWMTFWHYCQQEIPVRDYLFVIEATNGAVISTNNCPRAEYAGADTDTLSVTIRNLPAFVAEPHMPPERDLRGWIRLIYNSKDETIAEGWQRFGTAEADFFNIQTKPSSAISQKAAELVKDAGGDEDKIHRLYDFCQTQVTNFTWDDSPEMRGAKARHDAKSDLQRPRETLLKRQGNATEINWLFASLARAAGFEVRRALHADRSDLLNIAMRNGWDYMNRAAVAVKVREQWRIFSPGYYILPFGLLSEEAGGATAFIADRKNSIFVTLPVDEPSASTITRKGQLQLDAGGNLHGTIEYVYTGLSAVTQKSLCWWKSPAEVESLLRSRIVSRLPTAELSDITWEHLRSHDLPVILRYTVDVPAYAQRIGPRFVFTPNYFDAGSSPEFPQSERHHPVLFPLARTEHDEIEISLPPEFELDQATAPASVARKEDPVHASFALRFFPKRHALAYERTYVQGEGGQIVFPVEGYPWLKKTFDELHRSETHTLMLKPRTAPASRDKPADAASS